MSRQVLEVVAAMMMKGRKLDFLGFVVSFNGRNFSHTVFDFANIKYFILKQFNFIKRNKIYLTLSRRFRPFWAAFKQSLSCPPLWSQTLVGMNEQI
jgi:hypothetical protein